MKRRRKKLAIRKSEPASFKDWALLGSVVGNILQAINQAAAARDLTEAKSKLQSIQRDKKFLAHKLLQWQKAYFFLKNKADTLEQKFIELRNDLLKQSQELHRLHLEQTNKDQQISNLKKENEELVKKFQELENRK